mmetsp:Transcript_15080/g.32481  ORF Transcript_15080/g.32481 Transcript_15080/m.32481 type:complete len:257 (-) Transcript_15080:207-977(-)
MVRAAALVTLAAALGLAQVEGQLILPFSGIASNLRGGGGSFSSYSKTYVFHGDHQHEQVERTESYDLEDGRHIEKRSDCRDGNCHEMMSIQPGPTPSRREQFYKALMEWMNPEPQAHVSDEFRKNMVIHRPMTPEQDFKDPNVMMIPIEPTATQTSFSFDSFMIPSAVIAVALVGMIIGVAVVAYANRPAQQAPATKVVDEEMALPLASADHTRIAPVLPAMTAQVLLKDIYDKVQHKERLAVASYLRSLYERASV